MHELPLVIFTVFAQAVAASFVILELLQRLPSKYALVVERQQRVSIIFLLLCLLGLSGAAALTHLGLPLRAPNVLFGLAHLSAMSIEIVTVSCFGFFLTGTLFFTWRGIKNTVSKVCHIAALVLAFLQLIAIANVYYLNTVPLWATGWTWVNFIASGFISGSLMIALLFIVTGVQRHSLKKMVPVWIFTVVMSLLLSAAYSFHLADLLSIQHIELPRWMIAMQIIRVILIVCAFGMCIALAFVSSKTSLNAPSVFVATLMVVSAELCGRIVFYELSVLNHL